MAYQVNNFKGTLQTTVDEGTIDSTTDLRFVGKNYAGYGEVQNENFLHLMENFANTTQPPKAITGQVWYDRGNKKLKFYDADTNKWKVAGGAEVSTTQPPGLAIGEFWWDSGAKQLYAWSGTQYILVGPEASPELGSSAISADTIKDNVTPVANTHAVIKIIAGGEIVAIVNSDIEFTPAFDTGLLASFPKIKQGITLTGANSDGANATNAYRFWGTASNALKLNGESAANYILQTAEVPFTQAIKFIDAGFYVGDDSDIRIHVDNSEDAVIENKNNRAITIRISSGVTEKNVAIFESITSGPSLDQNTGIIPGVSGQYNLGKPTAKWNNVNAVSFIGNLLDNSLAVTYNSATRAFTGSFIGNVVSSLNSAVLINASTNIIGADNIEIRGNLFGSVTGNVDGTASNAQRLGEFDPSITVPIAANKSSVVVRNSDGEINAVAFKGVSDTSNRLKIASGATVDATWNSLDESTHYRSAKIEKLGYTIAARNSTGDLLANIFDGVATAAQYADLAEKYLADAEYQAGTVVMIGGEKEVTACAFGKRAIGVVSANPAFMMNKDLEGGTYIALKGRVPVKVIGSVKKGDDLIATNHGMAMMSVPHASGVFAVALESSDDTGVKLIEALVL
jgi:hypothetical protein